MTDPEGLVPGTSIVADKDIQQDRSLLVNSARMLGWVGNAIVEVEVFELQAAAVCTVDLAAHDRRDGMGAAKAILDADVLAMCEWPQGTDVFPPSPVSLIGTIVTAGEPPWTRAFRKAHDWNGFAASAILIPPAAVDDRSLLLECAYAGISVISTCGPTGVVMIQPGATSRAPTARRSTLDRWVEEKIYDVLLSAGYFSQVHPVSAMRERGPAANG